MNKIQLIPIISLVLIFSGCDYIKQKMNQSKDKSDTELTTAWSCSEKDDLAQINEYLKQQFIRNLDRNLREYSYYTAEKEIQNTIVNNIRFEIKQVRTLNDENTNSSQLSCESQLIAYLPKGLQKRAENAYVELYRGSEEEEMPLTLQDYIDSNSLVLADDQLKGHLNYFITKTDHDGITLQVQNENFVSDELIFISRLAIQYAAYIQENKNYQQEVSESVSREVEQTNLAQRALDIRKKELDTEKKQKVERLNQIWDNFDAEKKAQLQADQAEWFEKRDVDCKITAQKSIHDIDSKDRETYQEHYQYWTESMRKQNQELEYNKCFIQRTTERSIYLQNLL